MPTIAIRTIIGFLQGIILALLFSASLPPAQWPATYPAIFVPITMIAIFIPLLVVQGIASLRRTTMLCWIACAAVIMTGIACYAVFREVAPNQNLILPVLFIVNGGALFIAHWLFILRYSHLLQIPRV
jgi:hypothetical protein